MSSQLQVVPGTSHCSRFSHQEKSEPELSARLFLNSWPRKTMKDNKWLLLFETTKVERTDIQTDNARLYMMIELWPTNSAEARKQNYKLGSNQCRTLRTWSKTASFLIFCLCFQLRTNQRKPNHHLQITTSKPTTKVALFVVGPPLASLGQWPLIKIHLKPSLFFSIKLCWFPAFESVTNISSGGCNTSNLKQPNKNEIIH